MHSHLSDEWFYGLLWFKSVEDFSNVKMNVPVFRVR